MSVKLNRYTNTVTGPFESSNANNELRFKVPARAGFTDLYNSQLILKMSAWCTANNGNGTTVPVVFGEKVNGGTTRPVGIGGAAALIKNATVTSNVDGVGNTSLNCNIVKNNIDHYRQTRAEKHAMASFNGSGNLNDARFNGCGMSQFLKMYKPSGPDSAVTTASHKITSEVRIPLSKLDQYAEKIRQFPNIGSGDLYYKLDLEKSYDVVTNTHAISNLIINDQTAGAASDIGSATAPILFRVKLADAWSNNDYDAHPWYVGCPVHLSVRDNAVNRPPHYANISSLNVDSASGYMQIVLDTPFTGLSAAGAALTNVVMYPNFDDTATFKWSIEQAHLEMHELQLNELQFKSAMDAMEDLEIPWFEYQVKPFNVAASDDVNIPFTLDPMCAGVAVMTPFNDRLTSSADTATRYRFSLNNRNVDDYEIYMGPISGTDAGGVARQLHNDKLLKFFGNLDMSLRQFDLPAYDYDGGIANGNHMIYPLNTPMVPVQTQGNLNIKCSTAMTARVAYVVSWHYRQLVFKGGRVQKN